MKYVLHIINEHQQILFNSETNSWIPFADDNSDYQAYLLWVAEGNTAEEWEGN